MTKKNLIYLLVFAFGFSFASCDKDKESNSGVSVNTISAKWEISDSKSPYASFEFNKDGNYIVVENVGMNSKSFNKSSTISLFKNNNLKAAITRSSESETNLSPIHFGTYKIEGNKIILSGFGLIEVISITVEEFSFSFTLEATDEKNSFVAGKSGEPISSSSRTEMLCRTWIVEKVTLNGETQSDSEEIGTVVLFSKAGTYLVLYPEEEREAGLAEWKWANTEETKFYYSWKNWTDYWEENNIATINQLNNNTLFFQENTPGGNEWVYHLSLKN